MSADGTDPLGPMHYVKSLRNPLTKRGSVYNVRPVVCIERHTAPLVSFT